MWWSTLRGDTDVNGDDITERGGDLVENASIVPAAGDVVIRIGNSPVACLRKSVGLSIAGKLYETVSVDLDTAVTCPSFRVKNGAGATVALICSTAFTNSSIESVSPYVVPAGSLILKGRALIGVAPDRIERQNH